MIISFIKTTLLGGIVVLVPVLLLYLLLSEMLEALVGLASPIMNILPASMATNIDEPRDIALFVLLISAFLAGLALRSIKLKNFGTWVEKSALNKLPMYKAVKRLSLGLLGAKSDSAFTCGFVELSSGVRELVYIVEDYGNGYVTVMVPLAPTGFNGPLKIIESDRVVRVDASVGAASASVSEWGVGLQRLASS
jgi:uncharacterized membrane protein